LRENRVQIRDVTTSGALPSLEMTMRFAGARQRLLAHNIANIQTPNFVARDVSPRAFQKVLAEAVDGRRERTAGAFGRLDWRPTREIEPGAEPHALRLNALAPHGGVLGHDRNAADLERLMQDMVENASAYRVASDLYRAHKGTVMTAIAQRVG
jgi:flagellar basal-body rod protein FlgB